MQAKDRPLRQLVGQPAINLVTYMSQADTKSSQGKSRRRPSSGLSDGVNDEHMIDLTSIHMRDASNFPIDLDIPAEFQNMLAADILKSSEHIHVYDTICEKLFEERTVKFTALLFWLVFCLKFQPQSESIIDALRKRLSKVYTKIFSRLPRGKEELSNYLVLLVGYCIQMSFYDVFPLNRAKFDMRFILDIYHVVLYEVHGAICQRLLHPVNYRANVRLQVLLLREQVPT